MHFILYPLSAPTGRGFFIDKNSEIWYNNYKLYVRIALTID